MADGIPIVGLNSYSLFNFVQSTILFVNPFFIEEYPKLIHKGNGIEVGKIGRSTLKTNKSTRF